MFHLVEHEPYYEFLSHSVSVTVGSLREVTASSVDAKFSDSSSALSLFSFLSAASVILRTQLNKKYLKVQPLRC